MLALSILLNALIAAMCFGGSIWPEFKDNFGERMGMVVIGLTCIARIMYATEWEIAERSDVLVQAGVFLYGWGVMCAKLKARRKRVGSTLHVRAE